MTTIFARRVSTQIDLDRLASELRTVHPADKGMVITTSPHVARQIELPGGFGFLFLPEIVNTGPNGLTVNLVRLGSWARGMRSITGKGGLSRSGRPSDEARTSLIFNDRRERKLPVSSALAEATAILKEWPKNDPDRKPPHHSTVRRHVSRLIKANTSS